MTSTDPNRDTLRVPSSKRGCETSESGTASRVLSPNGRLTIATLRSRHRQETQPAPRLSRRGHQSTDVDSRSAALNPPASCMAHTLPPSVRASLHNGETPVYGVCAGSGSPHGHGPGYVNEATSTTAAVVAAEGGGNSTDGTPTLATTATGSDEVPPFIARSFSAPDHLASFPSGLFSPPILPPDFYAAPYYTRRKSLPLADDSHPDTTKAWGYVLLVVTFVVFAVGVYTTMVSKVLPVTGNRFLDAVRDDQYYCLLAPLTLTVAFYTVIWNWLGMKIFRHN